MDPLSISASVAGLITISTQILGIIGTIKSKNNRGLETLSREVGAVRGILWHIQEIIQFQSTQPTKSAEWLDALNNTLDDCGDVYLTLRKDLEGLHSSSRLDSLKMKVKWTLKEKDIQDMLRRLESYKLSLDLLLSVQTSTTTTNIEEVLGQVQKKLSLKPAESPAVKTPLSWRKKLAGLDSGPTQERGNSSDATPPTVVRPDSSGAIGSDMSHILPGPKATGWQEPGVYGITRDEGQEAPDLNSPNLTSVCEINVGKQKLSLVCGWEKPNEANEAIIPIRVHLLFKGPSPGDLYFMHLKDSLSMILSERIFVPAGKCSLILARCDMKDLVCPLNDLSAQENPEDFKLALGAYALKSSSKAEQVLVNFEEPQDRDRFLGHLYAVRYLQRMDPAFAMPNKLYHGSAVRKRTQHVQVGYADGTEKSYIYPYLCIEYSLEDKAPRLSCAAKPTDLEAIFQEDLPSLDIQIVGDETIVCNTPDGNKIRTFSITFGSLSEVVQMYHRLQDIVREWTALGRRKLDDYKTKKEWKVKKLEFWEGSQAPGEPFHNVIVVAKSDCVLKRLMMDIYDSRRIEKLASFYGVMSSSILFYKRHMRASSPDFFVSPVFQTGFWDLRNGGGTTAENFQAGQVRMYGPGEKYLCDELEVFVEALMEESKEAQKGFMMEASSI
ncbi:uncharacterized protein N7482_008143 [Penicillium canariense]|uniref:Fungal N-terminal domain-containing protein n=1 Tax=Penicillium canariense TaxID=189055 RepID=A0A9W9HSL3_9EURO|nr:uncharacterized protein N7482_008143 [Penicillium canariense]KAJ5157043.1 hypothetical protein N7482_008143 [Penicillium canariense]